MKKTKHFSQIAFGMLTLFFVCLFALLPYKHVHAATPKYDIRLAEGSLYYMDMDLNGSKETFEWHMRESDDYGIIEVKIKVNGQLLAYEEEQGFNATVSVIDVNTRDKSKEIILQTGAGDGYMTSMRVYRYYNNNFKLVYCYKYRSSNRLMLNTGRAFTYGQGIMYWQFGSIPEMGKYVKTGYEEVPLDCLASIKNIPLKYTNGKLIVASNGTYNVAYRNAKTLKKIKLYKKASKKSKVKAKLKKGSKLKVYKIKITGKGKGYAYVKTSSGKKGWIYLKPGIGKVLVAR